MTAEVTPKPFTGVRIEVATSVGFDEVLERLRALMGRVNAAEIVNLARSDISEAEFAQTVAEQYEGESGFMLFAEIDHGGWLPKFGVNRRTVRLILGNPLIAVTMIRHDITAGLFAPVEILVTEPEDDGQGAMIIYLRPSSLMVIADNPPLRVAATLLDAKLDALIARAIEA